MSSLNSRYEYSLATSNDGPDLLRLYECDESSGNISVMYTRRPNPYESLLREGDKVIFPIMRVKETQELCGGGCCVIRKAYVNGQRRITGYLTGLKIMPKFRRRVPYIQELYQELFALTKGEVDLFYTTILAENVVFQRLLEKKRKNMPVYQFLHDYTVYCFLPRLPKTSLDLALEQGVSREVIEFYEQRLPHLNLSPYSLIESSSYPRLDSSNIYSLKDAAGRVVAACGLVDQKHYKQYIVTKYSGALNLLSHLPLTWIGYPNLPKVGQVINYASIAMLCVDNDDRDLACSLMSKVFAQHNNYDFFMLGLVGNHPLNQLFETLKHIKYPSKLYTVHNDPSHLHLDERLIHLEVSLL